MNSQKCLEWCVTFGHRFPQDFRTALHVSEWLADKALEWADQPEEFAAVARARAVADALIARARASAAECSE